MHARSHNHTSAYFNMYFSLASSLIILSHTFRRLRVSHLGVRRRRRLLRWLRRSAAAALVCRVSWEPKAAPTCDPARGVTAEAAACEW